MKNWRTTVCGIVSGTGMLITSFFPEYAKIGGFMAAFGIMLGHSFAADSKCTDPDCPKNPNNLPPTMKNTNLLILTFCFIACLLVGCSYLRSTTTTADGNKTTVRAYTLFDGSSDLAKFKNSAGGTNKPSGTSIGTLSQESNTTNLVPVISGVAEGVVRGLGAAAK